MKDNQQIPEQRLTSEIEQFKTIGAWCTPEFLIQSSQTREGIYSVGNKDEFKTVPKSEVSGRYNASHGPLAAVGQIDKIIGELRALLQAKAQDDHLKSHNRNHLLELWMSVEHSLTKEEHQELCVAVLNHLFPGEKVNINLNRDKVARLGGY